MLYSLDMEDAKTVTARLDFVSEFEKRAQQTLLRFLEIDPSNVRTPRMLAETPQGVAASLVYVVYEKLIQEKNSASSNRNIAHTVTEYGSSLEISLPTDI